MPGADGYFTVERNIAARMFNSWEKISRNMEKEVRRHLSNNLGRTWKNPHKICIFNRSGTDGLKTRTFLKTRLDNRTGTKKKDSSGETRMYGNPNFIILKSRFLPALDYIDCS